MSDFVFDRSDLQWDLYYCWIPHNFLLVTNNNICPNSYQFLSATYMYSGLKYDFELDLSRSVKVKLHDTLSARIWLYISV